MVLKVPNWDLYNEKNLILFEFYLSALDDFLTRES